MAGPAAPHRVTGAATVLTEGAGVVMLLLTAALLWQRR